MKGISRKNHSITVDKPSKLKSKAGRSNRGRKGNDKSLIASQELYRLLFNNSNDAMFVSLRVEGENLPGKFIEVNDTACVWLGYTREELLQTTPLNISAPLSTISEDMVRLANDKHIVHEEIFIAKDGREIPVEINTHSFDLLGKLVNLSIARDITERKQAEERLRLQSAALDESANAIVITDQEGTIQWVNPAWCALTGYSSEEANGQNPRILKSGMQDDAFYKNLWETIPDGKSWQSELINKRKNGSLYPEEQTITPVHNERGLVTHFIAIELYISERKQMEEKLKRLSTHDTLTGLFNRGFFEEELARLEHGRQFPISLVIADVDRLKNVNDQQGHTAGDNLLKRTAQVLKAAFRSEDIIARIGGDEFAVILPNTDATVAETVLLRARQILKKHNTAQADFFISISFGIGTAEKSVSMLKVLKEADANMYREKRERYRD